MVDFSEPGYRESLGELLAAINPLVSGASAGATRLALSSADLSEIGKALLTGRYRPVEWDGTGERRPGATALNRRPPVLADAAEYLTANLLVTQYGSEFTSVNDGGCLYEDPFYACLACYNLGVRRSLALIPMADEASTLWAQRPAIIAALRDGTYAPERWFGFVAEAPAMPQRELNMLPISGGMLAKTRDYGNIVTTLDKALGLAQYVVHQPDLAGAAP